MSEQSPTPSPDTLHGWFAATVAAHPDETALEVGGEAFTYATLNTLVNALAGAILDANQGRRPARVGLLATRSALSYVGYLAVQRLSATVVPLNPIFPDGRNAAIARAGDLDLALVEPDGGHDGADLPVPVLAPPSVAELLVAPERDLPAPSATAGDVAYILFTSGSTGTPKGVPMLHGNVAAYVRHVVPRYGVVPGCRLSQTFDLTFDPSVFDMFAAWASGATLVVPTRDDLLAPVRYVRRERITHWFSVPSVVSFAERLRGLRPGAMPDLRCALFAGEALTLHQARAWQAAAPAAVIENIYGPTELTVTCTEYRLPADPGHWPTTSNGTVPIGEVYPHLEHAVVDESGHRAADGELCVRGPQRFPGYLDPAQNAGRFYALTDGCFSPIDAITIPDASHWYRTGDRVHRESGQMVHLGRLDHQLKIRGYRVELGEIESALLRRPGIREAVVLPVAGRDGEIDLVAVCTGAAEAAGEDTVLAELRTGLPPYMIPRRIHWYDELPLNVNGKVDRKTLTDRMTLTIPA